MLHSSANATSEKCPQEPASGMVICKMPSFSSIKGAHTDSALMLARARSTGSNATPAPMGSGHADPSALLARARGEAGMGGLPRNNALSGISLLPFQSGMLRFEQPRAASERAGGAASESAGQRGALASECHSSVVGAFFLNLLVMIFLSFKFLKYKASVNITKAKTGFCNDSQFFLNQFLWNSCCVYNSSNFRMQIFAIAIWKNKSVM